MNKNLIAVYGSLRKDMGNHHMLENSKYLGTFTTEPTFSLYSLGSYPGLKQNGNTSVVMEVYEVNDNVALRVDHLESYQKGIKPTVYDKIQIETPYGEASVYIYVNDISEDRLVKSGDWKEYKTNLQQNVAATY